MKTLATNFTKWGEEFVQLQREGRVALYSRTKPGRAADFEVIIVQQYPAYEMNGVAMPATEAFPSSNSWGEKGWTYTADDRAGADARFHALCVRFGTRKSVPVRRRSPIPLPVNSSNESTTNA